MAAQYAADHADDGALAGLVLLGAYTASDLSASDLGTLVVYGSEDQVLNRGKLADSAALMPEGARTIEIVGGNHAGFGAYGPQEEDGSATISAEEQQGQTAAAIDAYVKARRQAPPHCPQPPKWRPSPPARCAPPPERHGEQHSASTPSARKLQLCFALSTVRCRSRCPFLY